MYTGQKTIKFERHFPFFNNNFFSIHIADWWSTLCNWFMGMDREGHVPQHWQIDQHCPRPGTSLHHCGRSHVCHWFHSVCRSTQGKHCFTVDCK